MTNNTYTERGPTSLIVRKIKPSNVTAKQSTRGNNSLNKIIH